MLSDVLTWLSFRTHKQWRKSRIKLSNVLIKTQRILLMSDSTWLLFLGTSLLVTREGNGNPLQCSCLENPRDGGAYWAAVYGVTQSQTLLKWFSSSSSSSCCLSLRRHHGGLDLASTHHSSKLSSRTFACPIRSFSVKLEPLPLSCLLKDLSWWSGEIMDVKAFYKLWNIMWTV